MNNKGLLDLRGSHISQEKYLNSEIYVDFGTTLMYAIVSFSDMERGLWYNVKKQNTKSMKYILITIMWAIFQAQRHTHTCTKRMNVCWDFYM